MIILKTEKFCAKKDFSISIGNEMWNNTIILMLESIINHGVSEKARLWK